MEPETQQELDECPFCGGREDKTPPETLRLPAGGDWMVRVVPNLYPAIERQEVVVHSPGHVRTFAELGDDEVALVARAWEERMAAGHADGFAAVQCVINEGRAAGSSLAHSHSQLAYLHDVPPVLAAESSRDRCGVCELVELTPQELVVARDGSVEAIVHLAGRLPYELLVAQTEHALDLVAGLRLVRDCVQRLRAVEGPVPWNAWLHEGIHPHIELVPRLTVMAGLELGAGVYVNSLDPAEAAARLRAA